MSPAWRRAVAWFLCGAAFLSPLACRRSESQNQTAGASQTASSSVLPPAVTFVNQDGQTVTLDALDGKFVVMSFIYTRCPMPTMCPMLSQTMAQLQTALSPEERRKVALVTVTFDPEYDTPTVLREYGEAYGADFSLWQFWRAASVEETQKFIQAYGVWAEKEGDVYNHNMRTVILNPDGTLNRTLTGSAWDANEVAEYLRKLIAQAEAS